MLEKEWLEAQKKEQLENSNMIMLIDENDEEDDLAKIDKRTFIRTQNIEITKAEVDDGKAKRRNGSLSKTMSKNSLLAKIKTAMGKQHIMG